MHRRTAIRNLVLISAGAAVLPSCMEQEKPGLPLKNLAVTGSQQQLLSALSESIIPATHDFPGANALKSHEFILTMMDDCARPEDRQSFTTGLVLFEDICKKKWNVSFMKASAGQRSEILREMEANKDNKGDAYKFYRTVKRYTIQSFTSSQKFLTDVRKFTLVPGSNFKGCVPIGSKKS